jgi:anti-sigma regulatory factor (Ser/Thr protein kinase)
MSGEQRTQILLDREYDGSTRTLRDARSDVVGLLRARPADQDLQDRAELVVSELASNAVQASPGSPYGLRVWFDRYGSLVMAVTSRSDRDSLPPRGSWGPATLLAARGRGLLIVGSLADQVDVEQPVAGRVTVTVTLRVAAAADDG